MCLPTCPTYDETGLERNSPRGRIGLMRAIADGELEATKAFAEEMGYCLGCLACVTACPAGVDYAHLFENARAEAQASGVQDSGKRRFYRWLTLRFLFMRPRVLRWVGWGLRLWQRTGLEQLFRRSGGTKLLPPELRRLEPMTPRVEEKFTHRRIRPLETPADLMTRLGRPREQAPPTRGRVALLTGCVQDLFFSGVNRDTADVLLANGWEVLTPSVQYCCGSLHGHNGELEMAKELACQQLDTFPLDELAAVVTNAAGCGSHLKHYDRLLGADSAYQQRAQRWSQIARDIHEFLDEQGLVSPQDYRVTAGRTESSHATATTRVAYHEACHLVHGQGISDPPRKVLEAIPGLHLVALEEASWCCGSAGVYSITQPEQAQKLLDRKVRHIRAARPAVLATANPGCHLQIERGLRESGLNLKVMHPVSLLARSYRGESLI